MSIIAGNWKMNLNLAEAKELASAIRNGLKPTSHEVIVFPSDLHIPAVSEILEGSSVKLGIQNIYPAARAAFTGESCLEQSADFGVSHALIGHSERRQFLGETNQFCNEKILFSQKSGITAVYCVGETLDEREKNQTMDVVKKQLSEGLKGTSAKNLVIAYEPVWAIGTGKVATPEQAEEVHAFIRKELKSIFGENNIEILYGGSVKPDNIVSLMKMPNIEGGLVGGASLKADSFLALL